MESTTEPNKVTANEGVRLLIKAQKITFTGTTQHRHHLNGTHDVQHWTVEHAGRTFQINGSHYWKNEPPVFEVRETTGTADGNGVRIGSVMSQLRAQLLIGQLVEPDAQDWSAEAVAVVVEEAVNGAPDATTLPTRESRCWHFTFDFPIRQDEESLWDEDTGSGSFIAKAREALATFAKDQELSFEADCWSLLDVRLRYWKSC